MIKVTKLKYLGGHRLQATFSDGSAGEHDFSALVAETGPMVEPLRDPAYFARVFLEDGAPTWPNSFDMDPEWLRREIEAAGASRAGWNGLSGTKSVLPMRFGIGMNTDHTLEEVGQQFSVTPHPIRHIPTHPLPHL